MNKSFINQIAELYYKNIVIDNNLNLNLNNTLFVFPNKRAGLFFRKAFLQYATQTIFAPNISDINSFCQSISDFQLCNDIELLTRLYNSYKEIYFTQTKQNTELLSFDSFINQGYLILHDFDEIDKYLVNPKLLFDNINNLEQLKADPNYFSEDQINTINSFWNNTLKNDNSGSLKFQNSFVSFWQLLYPLYCNFTQNLKKEKIGYMGMIYRNVIENILTNPSFKINYKRIVFIGFNILTKSEYELLYFFNKNGIGDYYFDYPTQYGDNSPFATTVGTQYYENTHKFPSKYQYTQPNKIQCANINIYGSTSSIEQCEIASKVIQQQYNSYNNHTGTTTQNINEESIVNALSENTALVLADESILHSILQTLPNYIKQINVTMGYPLSQTPISSLIDNIINLQTEKIISDKHTKFYHKQIINILSHPYIQYFFQKDTYTILDYITRNNYIRIDENILIEEIKTINNTIAKDFFSGLFKSQRSSNDIIKYLNQTLNFILKIASEEKYNKSSSIQDIEIEYIVQYKQNLIQLKNILEQSDIEIDIKTFSLLIRRITSNIKVQFKGEPLNGFQIMGMLESRLLDFENIIIVGFNDKYMPGTKQNQSIIPYNLRKAYNLPTYEKTDAAFSYNFFRMIYHSKNVTLIYNSKDSNSNNEISRYYYQIKYLLPIINKNFTLIHKIPKSKILSNEIIDTNISIVKTPEVINSINKYKKPKDTKGIPLYISASTLKSYIACPLKFYFSHILKIKDAKEIKENNNASLLGTIFHKAMELYYIPNNKTSDTKQLVQQAFEIIKEDEIKGLEIEGFNHLIYNVVCNLVENTIKFDSLRNFTYISSEKKIEIKYRDINLIAIIDRIDKDIDGTINIIDYKTTKTNNNQHKYYLLDLINSTDSANHEIFQILLYCYIYEKETNCDPKKLKPIIYNIYEITKHNKTRQKNYSELFDIQIEIPQIFDSEELIDNTVIEQLIANKDNETNIIQVNCYNDIKPYFEIVLNYLYDEIFNITKNFSSNNLDKHFNNCKYCPYIKVCQNEDKIQKI